jgi:hypothetical protein
MAPVIPGGFLVPALSLRRLFRKCKPEQDDVSVTAPVAPANRDSATADQEFEPRAPLRTTDVGAAAPGASLDGRGLALGGSVGRGPRLRGRPGSGLPGQQVQKAHLRDYHLDDWRLLRRWSQALGGKPRGGRVKTERTSLRYARGRQPAAQWRFVAREHLVQDGAEGRHIGPRISVAHEATRRKQRRSSRAQHHGSRRYFAVRPAGPVQSAEINGHVRSATQS